MTPTTLPDRVTTEDTCLWLAAQTNSPWTLARLLEHGLTPYVWLDYTDELSALFADGITGYAAPVVFIDDTQRLAAGADDVLIRFTRDSDRIAIQLKAPGIRRPLADLRFFRRDIAQLAHDVLHPKPVEVAAPPAAKESLKGISKEEVLIVFGGMVKLNLEQALAGAVGIFGDDGARVRKNSRGGKNSYLWNPVTLAFGLNDVHRVPMSRLKKAFATQDILWEWQAAWLESLALLGE